jgi:hypothetical protein
MPVPLLPKYAASARQIAGMIPENAFKSFPSLAYSKTRRFSSEMHKKCVPFLSNLESDSGTSIWRAVPPFAIILTHEPEQCGLDGALRAG